MTFGDTDVDEKKNFASLKQLIEVNKQVMMLKSNSKQKIYSEEKNKNSDIEVNLFPDQGFSSTESFFKKPMGSPSTEKIKRKIEYYKENGMIEGIEEDIKEQDGSPFMSIIKKVCFEESAESSSIISRNMSEYQNPCRSLSIIGSFRAVKTQIPLANPKKIFFFGWREGRLRKSLNKLNTRGVERDIPNMDGNVEGRIRQNFTEDIFNKRPKTVRIGLMDKRRSTIDRALSFYGKSRLTSMFKSLNKPKMNFVKEEESEVNIGDQKNKNITNFLKKSEIFKNVFNGVDDVSLPITDQSAVYNRSLSSVKRVPEPQMSRLPTKIVKQRPKLQNQIIVSDNNFTRSMGLSGIFRSIDSKRSVDKLKKNLKNFGKGGSKLREFTFKSHTKETLNLHKKNSKSLVFQIKKKFSETKLSQYDFMRQKRTLGRSNSITNRPKWLDSTFDKENKSKNIGLLLDANSRSRSPYSFRRMRNGGSSAFSGKFSFARKDSLKERLSRLKEYFDR